MRLVWLLRDEEPEEYSNLLETLLELSPLSQGDDVSPTIRLRFPDVLTNLYPRLNHSYKLNYYFTLS